jgi:hypothetical protein
MQRLPASSLCLWLGALVFESGVFCQTYVQITVAPPNSGKTFPTSINKRGEIVGCWQGPGSRLHGFVRAAGGTITAFDVPGPLPGFLGSTFPQSINDSGSITGSYASGPQHGSGFIRDPAGEFYFFRPTGQHWDGSSKHQCGRCGHRFLQ